MARSPGITALRRFEYLIGDLDAGDVVALLNHKSQENKLYQFDVEKKESQLAEAPWPVTWLLARMSPKHVFHNKGAPDLKILKRDLHNYGVRIQE